MVDVAAIFDEVFGPDERTQRSCENGCVRCVGVPEAGRPLETNEIPSTPATAKSTPQIEGVSEAGARCVRDIVESQRVTGQNTPTHQTHLKNKNLATAPDPDEFQERAALILDGHTRIWDDYGKGKLLPEPIHELTVEQAETQTAGEQGFDSADDLHATTVARWAQEIDRLTELKSVSHEGIEALRRAQEFIADGWAAQCVRLGWDEVQLFGVCPRAPWARLDRRGAAFGGVSQAVTTEALIYVGGLRRYRAIVNNDGGAVPVWELAEGMLARNDRQWTK